MGEANTQWAAQGAMSDYTQLPNNTMGNFPGPSPATQPSSGARTGVPQAGQAGPPPQRPRTRRESGRPSQELRSGQPPTRPEDQRPLEGGTEDQHEPVNISPRPGQTSQTTYATTAYTQWVGQGDVAMQPLILFKVWPITGFVETKSIIKTEYNKAVRLKHSKDYQLIDCV